MSLRLGRLEKSFPLLTELRCGTCFRKFGMANIIAFEGSLEILCTRRSRQETCHTLNTYEGTTDGTLKHTFERVQNGETNVR